MAQQVQCGQPVEHHNNATALSVYKCGTNSHTPHPSDENVLGQNRLHCQSQTSGQHQPIVAKVGGDITLPCHVKPATDVFDEMMEWSRSELKPRFVHVRRSGEDLLANQNPSYQGRTSVSVDRLKQGDASLTLSKVKLSDEGKYRCFIPRLNAESSVQLVVCAVSSPVISSAGIDEATRGLVLQCESAGWYPEPEVLWLDGEGHVLSAGPTETVRGPDDLYTVSSRVTVDKRHSNSFTCRVQQNHINQTREMISSRTRRVHLRLLLLV
ncbi:butyrophilin subfamily 1 member A1-like [Plectropomus leopardus]|uniref:butyrophilin subfamily 1 member A1-like n=1 Tax=Plectropomus leopardus TaxID=160734 RepID=UPI001C4B876C|nr:butyrophilin subfamily 1 member A1-like [Plectropomus leopardus]